MPEKDLNAIQIIDTILNMDSSETLEIRFHNRPGYKYLVKKVRI